MIRVFARHWRVRIGDSSSRCSRIGRRCTVRRRRPARLIDKLELTEGHRHVLLAYAEKAAHPDNDGVKLTILINDDFVDIANLLVLWALNIQPDKLGAPPLSGLLLSQEMVTSLYPGRRRRRGLSERRNRGECRGHQAGC
jgi:hypothetical protein